MMFCLVYDSYRYNIANIELQIVYNSNTNVISKINLPVVFFYS